MIYLLNSQDPFLKKRYGLDYVIDYSKNKMDFEKLVEEDMEKRIGILNFTTELKEKLSSINYPIISIGSDGEYLDPSYKLSPLTQDFFMRDAEEVAIELLGKLIWRKTEGSVLLGKILETEAYYGDRDPASRAYKGKRNYNKGMWKTGGHIFVYMVHANWMFNITTDGNEAQAVLIRAVEPLMGIEYMYKKRKREKIKELCNGPGKWSRAFNIEKDLNETHVGNDIIISESPWKDFEIKRSHRIGVTKDLEEPLRFFIPSIFTSNNRVF